jgi:hypothetical protein
MPLTWRLNKDFLALVPSVHGTLLEVTTNHHPHQSTQHRYKVWNIKSQAGHIWIHCKQPSRSLWWWGGHCQWECSEKINSALLPKCCNWVAASQELPRVYLGQEGAPKEEIISYQSFGTPWSPVHFQNYFSGKIMRQSYSNPHAGNSSSWHTSTQEYCRAHTRQLHWRRYGYFNYHSPTDNDGSTESRQWRGKIALIMRVV